jgi:meiotically up-regulated gene 157 (Mug157) protein
MKNFNQHSMYDQIDSQINQLQQMREQIKNSANQQPAINQTFQIAPSNLGGLRYFNTIDDVSKETVMNETPFFSKDMTVMWIKNSKNEIRTYELTEIIPKDSKDIQIEYLQAQIEELKGMIKNDANATNANAKQTAADTTTDDGADGITTKKSEPAGIQKVSRSKEK